ncbi:MAG TPA: CHASE3 domain-containing protein [Novosphingobium sp.]|nr:CHASE3 domain-containing protein [Novosphingobium sp.]
MTVAAALMAASVLVVSTLRTEREQRARVDRTLETLMELRDLGRALIDAETGQRGYFITLDQRYLGPYRAGSEQFPRMVGQVRRSLAEQGDPERVRLFAEAEALGTAKLAELERSIVLVEQSRVLDAQQAILSDQGKSLMDRFRLRLAELETSERALLARTTEQVEREEQRLITLLAALVTAIVVTLALGLRLLVRAAQADSAEAQAHALGEARDRADLLARELNHRVKNLFAVILAIVRMSGRGSPEAKPVIETISQRIHALVAAHDATQGPAGRSSVDLRELVDIAVAPYYSDSERCVIEGEAIELREKAATPLGLMLHELVTNAVKYGAWSNPGGTVRIAWSRVDGRVRFVWREQGARDVPASVEREGFGLVLIRSSAQQLGGTVEREFHRDGIEVRIEFPG